MGEKLICPCEVSKVQSKQKVVKIFVKQPLVSTLACFVFDGFNML